MGFPRSRTVDPTVGAVYHCISRCARRLFLIADAVRTAWIVRRLEFLASAFAVDVLEYAVLSNHIHLVLRLRPELAWCWTDEETAERWLRLRAAGPMGVAVADADRPSPEAIRAAVQDQAAVDDWRGRLADLGWFHKELKEPCARSWNREDGMEGCPFWQGRYAAKVALDDAAVVCQSLYVLLNPIRAGTESAIGQTELTSMGRRMRSIMAEIRAGRHDDALAAFESRVENGRWTPVFPCDPGSVTALSDEEYARRVARGRHRTSVRQAMRKEAETLTRLATDAPVEELLPLALGEQADAETDLSQRPGLGQGRPRLPRHRLKPRASSMPPADVRLGEASWHTAVENPFSPRRTGQAAGEGEPILRGMTLGAMIRLADEEGRRERPDKPGVIAARTPLAIDVFRRMALGGEGGPPAPAPTSDASAGGPWLGALAAELRAVVAQATGTMSRHRDMLASIVGVTPAGGADGAPSPAFRGREGRVRWFGSAAGDGASLEAEANRRRTSAVVRVRPTAV